MAVMPEVGEGVVEMPLVTEAEESWETSQSHSLRAHSISGKGWSTSRRRTIHVSLCSVLPVVRPQSIVGHTPRLS